MGYPDTFRGEEIIELGEVLLGRRDPAAALRARPHRVLIADEDVSARRDLVQRAFAGDCCEIREAENGAGALAQLDGWTPDVVVTDLMREDAACEGMALIEALRARDDTRDVLIVVTSGVLTHEMESRLRAVGASAFLRKPFDSEAMWVVFGPLVEGWGGGVLRCSPSRA